MIPVVPADEPEGFDESVRKPGLAWLKAEGLEGVDVAPPRKKIKAYWTDSLPDLLSAYNRICAYASLRIAPITGGHSVEHFAPKSRALSQAYEWSNYRLVCAKLNARKNNFTDVIDPFDLAAGTFQLNVLNGSLTVASHVQGAARVAATKTVARLKLDDGEMRAARIDLIDSYLAGRFDSDFLNRESPFIWAELGRQNMLR